MFRFADFVCNWAAASRSPIAQRPAAEPSQIMLAFTHVATGLLAASTIAIAVAPPFVACTLLLLGGILGSLLPDLDHPQSWVGRRLWFISMPLAAAVGHRGVTHSLIGMAVATWGAVVALSWSGTFDSNWEPFVTGVCFGYLSHLIGDWASNSGIPLFWPDARRFKCPLVVFTGSLVEWALSAVLWIAAIYMSMRAVAAAQ